MDVKYVPRIKIKKTHPALYKSIRNVAILSICLAVNFWLWDPAFRPLDIPNDVTGGIFFVLGVSQLVFLIYVHNIRMTRNLLGISVAIHLVWGVLNTYQWQLFGGGASLQLPLYIIFVALTQRAWIIEPAVNPMTEHKEQS